MFRIRVGHFVERHGLILLIANRRVGSRGRHRSRNRRGCPPAASFTALLAWRWPRHSGGSTSMAMRNALIRRWNGPPKSGRPWLAVQGFGYIFLPHPRRHRRRSGGNEAGRRLPTMSRQTVATALFLALRRGGLRARPCPLPPALSQRSHWHPACNRAPCHPTALVGIALTALAQVSALVAILVAGAIVDGRDDEPPLLPLTLTPRSGYRPQSARAEPRPARATASPSPPDASAAEEIEHLVGCRPRCPIPPYVGLWTASKDFSQRVADLHHQATCGATRLMRNTIHLVTARDGLEQRPHFQSLFERGWQTSHFGRNLVGVDLTAVVAEATAHDEEAAAHVCRARQVAAPRWPRPRTRSRSPTRVPLPGAGSSRCRHAHLGQEAPTWTSTELWLGQPLHGQALD